MKNKKSLAIVLMLSIVFNLFLPAYSQAVSEEENTNINVSDNSLTEETVVIEENKETPVEKEEPQEEVIEEPVEKEEPKEEVTTESKPKEDGNLNIEIDIVDEEIETDIEVLDEANTLLEPGRANVKGRKKWDDQNNAAGKRPDSITVILYRTVEGSTDKHEVTRQIVMTNNTNNWDYDFGDLPVRDEDGNKYNYFVEEMPVPDYTLINSSRKYDLTNKYTPEFVDVEGQKHWEDNDNQDGKRPENIVVQLLANGVEVAGKTATVTGANDWKYKFTGLPKYSGGNLINYTVMEVVVPEGYTSTVKGMNVTNSYTPKVVDVEGQKHWEDNDNQDGKRPENIVVQLLANGVEVAGKTATVTGANDWKYKFTGLPKYSGGNLINYTVMEVVVPEDYTSTVEGMNVTNSYTPKVTEIEGQKHWEDKENQDGKRPTSIVVELYKTVNGVTEKVDEKTVTPDTDGNWKYKFENLPVYESKEVIEYSVKEQVPEGYTHETDGFDITNYYTPEETEISVEKNWDDKDDQDGKRPTSIEVELFADGVSIDTQTLDEDNGWKYDWTGLDKFKAGVKIEYTVKEKDVPEGYTETQVTNDETNTVTITNSYTPEVTKVEGQKTWEDKNDQDGKRPESIVVELYKTVGGKTIKVDEKTVTLDDNWSYKFENLPVYEDKELIEYSVKEQVPEGYTSEVKGFDITNSYKPEETELEVVKSWNDENDKDNIRPSSVTVELYAREKGSTKEGKLVDKKTLNTGNNWKYKWTKLDRYKDKVELEYYVTEKDVPKGYAVSYNVNKDTRTITVTNSHTPTTPTTPDKPKLPKSGIVATWGFGIVGIGLIGLGAYQFRKKKQG